MTALTPMSRRMGLRSRQRATSGMAAKKQAATVLHDAESAALHAKAGQRNQPGIGQRPFAFRFVHSDTGIFTTIFSTAVGVFPSGWSEGLWYSPGR